MRAEARSASSWARTRCSFGGGAPACSPWRLRPAFRSASGPAALATATGMWREPGFVCKAEPMKLVVCGAGGMLGQDLLKAAAAAEHEVVALRRRELDVT